MIWSFWDQKTAGFLIQSLLIFRTKMLLRVRMYTLSLVALKPRMAAAESRLATCCLATFSI